MFLSVYLRILKNHMPKLHERNFLNILNVAVAWFSLDVNFVKVFFFVERNISSSEIEFH